MRTYKGIVCEINKKYMIFMTSKGEFLRGVPTIANVQIGDEVEFHIPSTITLPKKKLKSYVLAPALVAAMLLIFLITALLPKTNSAYAYVQVGSELEIGVDERGTVISVSNQNKDNTIEMKEFMGLPLEEALTKAIVDISPGTNELLITTKYKDQEPSKAKENIEKAVNEVKKENPNKNKSKDSKRKNNENKDNNPNNKVNKENNGSSNKGNNGNNGNNGNSNNSAGKQNNSSTNEHNQLNKNINKEKSNPNSIKADPQNKNSQNKNNGKNSTSSKNNNNKNGKSNKDNE